MTGVEIDLLRGLTPEEADVVMSLGERVHAPTGTVIFKLGEPAEYLYLLLRGRVSLTLPMEIHGGEEDVLIEEKHSGETFGWSALVPPHRFTLRAATPVESELLALPRLGLQKHFGAHPNVGYAVTRNLAGVIGERLGIFQAMWLRQMQRMIDVRTA